MTEQLEVSAEKPKKQKVTRPRSTAGVNVAQGDVVQSLTGTRVEFGDRTGARIGSKEAELNLSIPPGTVPPGMVPRWFEDSGQGEIDRALAGWWGFVKDRHGVNITRTSGSRKVVLMAKEEAHYKEDKDLQMKRYRASIGEDAEKPLGDGIEAYTPNGETNKIKVTTDVFSS
jgi:hypothetical protein